MHKLTPPVNKNDHILGSPGVSIELVEYGDFQCSSCGKAYPIMKAIQKKFGKDLAFIFRHFPKTYAHEYSLPAALASEAASRQNKFWLMHDMIFENQSRLNNDVILEFAVTLKLDVDAFKKDLHEIALAKKVETDFESGARSGVTGTPSFFINGDRYDGDYDFDSLSEALELLVREPVSK